MSNERHFCFFQNKECEYFPCHDGIDEKDFNCLFCYCPLYALGKKCGGGFEYTEYGYKDCTNCLFPHKHENYFALLSRYEEIVEIVKRNDSNG